MHPDDPFPMDDKIKEGVIHFYTSAVSSLHFFNVSVSCCPYIKPLYLSVSLMCLSHFLTSVYLCHLFFPSLLLVPASFNDGPLFLFFFLRLVQPHHHLFQFSYQLVVCVQSAYISSKSALFLLNNLSTCSSLYTSLQLIPMWWRIQPSLVM